ncbi:MAG: DoxX family protein [Halobacteria archaeon]|nr:DoxX family protein [Halobacteria archaeon]
MVALETTSAGMAFLFGRLFFGVVLAFMGLNHFMDTDNMAQYAEAKDVPYPKIGVLASGAMLVLGGLAIASGVFPFVGSALVGIFFVVVTPAMHDFWEAEGEERQNEMIQFLKNVGLLGAALVFLDLSMMTWPYAVNVSVFGL